MQKTEVSKKIKISFELNNRKINIDVKPSSLLLDILRDELGMKGTKPGCNEGECGACTVLINGNAINSCLYLAVNANGKEITTIEGLVKNDGTLDHVQKAIIDNGAVQCGFCTSGMIMSIKSLENYYLSQNNDVKNKKKPNREEIKKWLEGNLCRCTGYIKIIDAAEKVLINEE